MFQNNPLLSQLKEQIQQDIPKRQGIVKATDKGYGFLETDKGKRFFIPPNEMKKVLHGDRINAFIRVNGEKSSAEPNELKKSETDTFVARLSMQQGKITVKPNNTLLKGFFKIQGGQKLKEQGFNNGDWVLVKLIKHALKEGKGFLVEVLEKIAESNDPFAYRLITVATHNLPNKAPEFDHPWRVLDPELERSDLTKLPFFTIDGINTQDMDDAIYIETTENGWSLTVAISDPSAYVPVGSDMDAEAKCRAFTLYLPNFNVPMLPRDLSDSLCSLKEGEKRATLCSKIEINHLGEIIGEAHFFAAWIKSHYRLNYNDVSNYLENEPDSDQWKPNKQLSEQLNTLNDATLKRLEWRTINNVVFKSQPDYTLRLNNKGEVYEILCEPRRTANRLVEESMIAANICAGDFLTKHKQQGVFNVHSGFATDRLNKAAELLAKYNIDTDATTLGTLNGYTNMRQQTALLHNCYLDHRLRKLLAYADTKNTSEAHFTMGVESYATWTSPIRKYGDLLNHRLIKAVLLEKDDVAIDEDIGTHLNDARKSQRLAERDVNNLLYSRYLKDQVDSKWRYKAEIFDIVKAGIRVRIQENGATFFVPCSLLCKDPQLSKQIKCDRELGKVIVAEQTEMQLGDIIDVILNNVKIETGQLIGRLADPLIIPD